jgi:succinate-semialdehyde dehydrogenase/glutarate-semialdehyde dehydrogenase
MHAVNTLAREGAVLDAVTPKLFVGGRWRDADGGATMAVEDPATGETLQEVADATAADARAALAAAHDAFSGFRAVPPRERGDVLRRAHDLMVERVEDLALLMTLEMGKPLAESRAEVRYAAAYLRWYAEEAVRVGGRIGPHEAGGSYVVTFEQPVGPCLLITPWNFPAAMATRKIGPAIAAGCTVVVKPAEQTPLTMLALAQIFDDAGLPPGVLNVITTGSAATVLAPVIGDERLRKLSFTGSTAVGKTLIRQASEQVLRMSMELGGNAPFLVFEDADLGRAVDGAMAAKMRNMGEACTAANRFLVHESLADEFAERLTAAMSALRVGPGTADGVDVGPLIDAAARAKVEELVTDAVDRGATVQTGGSTVGDRGYFYAPTVLTDVPSDARLLREEIFGPVAPITTFREEREAIVAANTTEYGLAAYVFTADLGRAFRMMEALDTGMIGVNQGMVSNAGAPFGGVKQSGFGREGGPEGVREYLATTYAALNAA